MSTCVVGGAPKRLNYIGSKFQLLDWITSAVNAKTGLFGGSAGSSVSGVVTVADIFAGTGIVSYHFRTKYGAKVISNDAELYSSVITHAFTCSVYSEKCKTVIAMLCAELEAKRYVVGGGAGGAGVVAGFVTRNYSPYEGNERMFFTVDNAQRIDYVRRRLEEVKVQGGTLNDDDYKFILASILITADNVSNVPAVYGCYLKNFKAKAIRAFILEPIHKYTTPCIVGSRTFCSDVLSPAFLGDTGLVAAAGVADITYIDPPYNERQYSKNYFPLNIIARNPVHLASVSDAPVLKGKTGIPADCFISPFCKRGGGVCEEAFDKLFRELKTKWIFLSYNSESIVPKEKMLEIMGRYGVASVEECDYKRFKSFKYNGDLEIKEYLFCLRKC